MRPDEDESSGQIGTVFQRQKEQFGLVANLLEGVELAGRFGEADEALRAENRGRQRPQEALKSDSFHRLSQGQKKRRGGVRQRLILLVMVMLVMIVMRMVMIAIVMVMVSL